MTVWDESQKEELSLAENELDDIFIHLAERWGSRSRRLS
jgi:hypothetical protein